MLPPLVLAVVTEGSTEADDGETVAEAASPIGGDEILLVEYRAEAVYVGAGDDSVTSGKSDVVMTSNPVISLTKWKHLLQSGTSREGV